ncbi:Putative LOC100535543, partial [Caligus rogercresseyi]
HPQSPEGTLSCSHGSPLAFRPAPGDFDYKITYVKGSLNLHADALSRGPLDAPDPTHDTTDELLCLALSSYSTEVRELQKATEEDESLSTVIEAA